MSSLASVQAQRTDFEKGKVDPKVGKANQSFENMRKETPLLKEFIALATKYHSLLTGLSSTGQAMGSILEKIGQSHDGESALAINKIAEVHKQLDSGRNKMAEELMSKVIVPIGAHYNEDYKEAVEWQKEYKKKRANSLGNIKKLEGKAKSSQKKALKNPSIMEPILKSLEEAVTNHDRILGDGLREIRLLERKRCCDLVGGWVDVIEVECEVLGICWDDLNNSKDRLLAFASDKTNVGDTESVINNSKPNQTVERLREARKTGYYDSNQMAYLQDTLRMSTLNISDLANSGGSSIAGQPSPNSYSRPSPPATGGPPLPSRTSTQGAYSPQSNSSVDDYNGDEYGYDSSGY